MWMGFQKPASCYISTKSAKKSSQRRSSLRKNRRKVTLGISSEIGWYAERSRKER